ncbi:MAG: DUF4169 family protein [Alphaproteobacteria bacterium]|nr:DUF4169 family protein [Alphaproteobacteria bacterium]MBF0393094.1 DUF4169 family protein [Alphaproteobacteria bacterium]
MAEVVNLNRFRKAKARTERERQAAENRVRFGRDKAERKALEREAQRQADQLDEKKLED